MPFPFFILAALQIAASDVAPPGGTLVFMQAEEAGNPVPQCLADGTQCQCPAAYSLIQRAGVNNLSQTLTCAPLTESTTPRALATEYLSIPRPSTYGK